MKIVAKKNWLLVYFTFRQAVWSWTIVKSIFTRHVTRTVHNETFIACKLVINPAIGVISVNNPIRQLRVQWYASWKIETTSHNLATLAMDISAFSHEKTGKRPRTMREMENILRCVFVWYRVLGTLRIVGEWLGVKIFFCMNIIDISCMKDRCNCRHGVQSLLDENAFFFCK